MFKCHDTGNSNGFTLEVSCGVIDSNFLKLGLPYGLFSAQRFAMWIPSVPSSKGTANEAGANFSSIEAGTWIVTLAISLPASPGTRTEPVMSAPHQ